MNLCVLQILGHCYWTQNFAIWLQSCVDTDCLLAVTVSVLSWPQCAHPWHLCVLLTLCCIQNAILSFVLWCFPTRCNQSGSQCSCLLSQFQSCGREAWLLVLALDVNMRILLPVLFCLKNSHQVSDAPRTQTFADIFFPDKFPSHKICMWTLTGNLCSIKLPNIFTDSCESRAASTWGLWRVQRDSLRISISL